MALRVALVGRPNVGKSTLFNRLIGSHAAITAQEAGTTRDRLEREVVLNRVRFTLVDVGGIETTRGGKLESDVQAQIRYALRNSDLLIFLVDSKSEITTDDTAVTELLRHTQKPIIFAANKFESGDISDLMNFASFGLGVPLGISAVQKIGLDELIHTVTKGLRKIRRKKSTDKQETKLPLGNKADAVLAIIGRPNVGKSSLVNKLLGEERVVVSDVPCTTRDVNDVILVHEEKTFRLLDTAGMKRAGKIGRGIDRFATGRTLNALQEADVALLLMDGSEKVVAQDLHVAEKALKAGCGIIVVVNKIDVWDDFVAEQERWLNSLASKFQFAKYLPVVMISAKTGANLKHIFLRSLDIVTERKKYIKTPELNRFIKKVVAEHAPNQRDNARTPPKIYFATQVEATTPTFVFFVNRPHAFHFSWRRYLENQLRETYGFNGTPVIFEFRERKRDPAKIELYKKLSHNSSKK